MVVEGKRERNTVSHETKAPQQFPEPLVPPRTDGQSDRQMERHPSNQFHIFNSGFRVIYGQLALPSNRFQLSWSSHPLQLWVQTCGRGSGRYNTSFLLLCICFAYLSRLHVSDHKTSILDNQITRVNLKCTFPSYPSLQYCRFFLQKM